MAAKGKPGVFRTITFYTILVLILYLAAELLAGAGLSLKEKGLYSWKPFEAEREEIIRAGLQEAAAFSNPEPPEDSKNRPPKTTGPMREVVHPYLGYVMESPRDDCSEHGFIDRRVLEHKNSPVSPQRDDQFIVCIFGGSFAYGTSITSSPGLLTSELKKLPALAEKQIVIHTVALGGYKQPQQLMALAYFLSLGAHYDLVVNIDGFNEVVLPPMENVPKKVFPFYPRNWATRVSGVRDPEMLIMVGRMASLKQDRFRYARGFSTRPLRYSPLGNLTWRIWDHWLERSRLATEAAYVAYATSARRQLRYVARGPSYSYADSSEMYADLARVWGRCSEQMDRLCRANGIPYLHFLQPNQYVPDSKPMGDAEKKAGFHAESPFRPIVVAGYPHLVAEGQRLRRQGVAYTDLTMTFADNDEPLYYDVCCHLNRRGYDLLIGRIAAEIRAVLHEPEQ